LREYRGGLLPCPKNDVCFCFPCCFGANVSFSWRHPWHHHCSLVALFSSLLKTVEYAYIVFWKPLCIN
jgi:hypothetical protein